jgi:predicted ATPase
MSRLLFPPYTLDTENEQLWRLQELIYLRAKPFALLRHLVENPRRLLTHEELRKAIWPQTHVSHGVLREHLREVRAALGDNALTPRFIETVPRRGYRFLGQVDRDVSTPAAGADLTPTQAERPRIVGRSADLSRLRAALEKASTGHRQVVFVTGEPGIGKSALLEAFLAEAVADSDLHIGRGQCIEQRGESEPYLPLLEALEGLCRSQSGEKVIEIVRQIAPTWLVQLPGLIDRAAFIQLQQSVLGIGRSRMLREIAETLRQISAQRPLVLLLEDLQWSDPSTLTLIDLLARRTESARMLIIATHRPVTTLSASHPLQALLRELVGRNCEVISLEALNVDDVEGYVSQRVDFSSGDLIPIRQVAQSIYQRTGGNPLFMTAVVEALLGGEGEGAENMSLLHERINHIDRMAPRNVMQAIDQQYMLLSPDEQGILQSASVAGFGFSAAAVAAADDLSLAAAEEQCAALARRMSFLQQTGEMEWPDGTVAACFRFRHEIFWEAVYRRITTARRAMLHQRVGEREERAYGDRSEEISAELARHFEQARDFHRMLKYREQAAQMALHRCASREAMNHVSAALGNLHHLPEEHQRVEYELRFRLLEGIALQATRGYGAAEVKEIYQRASELCSGVGETPQLFAALMGIWIFAAGRCEWQRARELAEKAHLLAQNIGDPALLARSWRALGHVAFFSGDVERANEELQCAVKLAPQKKNPLDPNTAVDARCVLAWTLEILGLSDRALAVMRKAMALAEQSRSAFDLTYATFFGAVFYTLRREWEVAQNWSRRLSAMAEEHGLPYFQLMGMHQLGVAMTGAGQAETGLSLIRRAIAAGKAAAVESVSTGMYLRIGEASLLVGDLTAGLEAIDHAFELTRRKGERIWEAELHRIKGNLLLRQGLGGKRKSGGDNGAEECFLVARDLARTQGALKWELRAAVALGHLWKAHKRKKDARELLIETRRRFSEGLDSADLADADALIAQL